jgi:hypothetical protein
LSNQEWPLSVEVESIEIIHNIKQVIDPMIFSVIDEEKLMSLRTVVYPTEAIIKTVEGNKKIIR